MCVFELHKRFLSSFGFAAGPKPKRLAFAKGLAPQAAQQRVDLSVVLGNLVGGTSSLFVQQADGATAVQEVGLVLTADQAALATAIEGDADVLAQLTHVGITELLIATGDTQAQGDVTLLGQEYHKVVVG